MLKLGDRDLPRGSKKAKKLGITSSRFKYEEMSKHATEAIEYVKLKDRTDSKVTSFVI